MAEKTKRGNIFRDSLMEMKKVRSLVMMGILTALCLAVEPVSLPIGPSLYIKFSFIFMSVAGFMFGPVSAGAVGIASDIVCFVFFPKGSFFPGYTLSALLGGVIYGVFLYRRDAGNKMLILWAALCKLCINLFINAGLGTVWVMFFVPKAFHVLLWPRLAKNLLLLPIEVIVMVAVLAATSRIMKRMGWGWKQ